MLNELAGVPGVSSGLHLCRGTYDNDWISTGTYETISKQLFQRAANYDTLLLEYDDERSGSFSALGDIPDDKTVVLGLVSTKFDPDGADRPAGRADQRGERLLPAGVARAVDAVRVRLGRTGQPDQRGRPGEQAPPSRPGRRPRLGVRQLPDPASILRAPAARDLMPVRAVMHGEAQLRGVG